MLAITGALVAISVILPGMLPGSVRVVSGDIFDWIHERDRKRVVVAYRT